jgi:hypothetical protein
MKQSHWKIIAIAILLAGTSGLAHAQYQPQPPRYVAQPYGTPNQQGNAGYAIQQGYGAPAAPSYGAPGQPTGAPAETIPGMGLLGGAAAGAAIAGALGTTGGSGDAARSHDRGTAGAGAARTRDPGTAGEGAGVARTGARGTAGGGAAAAPAGQ